MKNLIFVSLITLTAFVAKAQYPTISTSLTPGVGIGIPLGPNCPSDAALHIRSANNGYYSSGAGQSLFYGETQSAPGDYIRIMNASGSNAGVFTPLFFGFGKNHNLTALNVGAGTVSAKDNGTSPMMGFTTYLNFTPLSSCEPSNGSIGPVITRPLFRWANYQNQMMQMNANGNVLLGLPTALYPNPLAKFTVNTASQNDGIRVNQTGTTSATLSLIGGGPVGSAPGQSRNWALHSTGPGNYQGAGHLFFWDWTTNIERMRIHENGNVGINTVGACGGIPMAKLHVNGTVYIGAGCFTPCSTTVKMPVGYKLYVEDGILTEKVKVAVKTNCNWADHVFASDYKLQPLSEVESFIEKNNHLPGIPSANTLVAEGLDLGEMQAKQMEKIEELTLYMIEMKKEIDELKKENQVLKSSSNNKN